jgi:heterodisulfide reductase subunit B
LYYGCLLGRPEWVTGFDVDPYESFLEELVRVLGAEPVSWAYPKHCCGAHLGVTRPASAERLVARIHDFARRAGANCLVVFCPMCQMNLELRTGEGAPLPVLYISELIGLASGSPRVDRWMDKHLVDPRPLLRSLNIF